MNMITRVAAVVLCLFAAIACYAFGVPEGGLVFVLFGVVFEGLFWTGILGRRKKSRA